MKTNILIGFALMLGINASAQEVDDMYFRSKDREKQVASVSTKAAQKETYSGNYDTFKKKNFDETTMLDEYNNPTDSYSARNINPEYVARSNSEQATVDEQNYFVEGYTTQAARNQYTSGYNSYNSNTWNNAMYAPGYYGPSFYNSFYSPYYGYNNPWGSPYWCGTGFNSGWSLSMSYMWGNMGNPGWNMGIGYTWGNPYYGGMWGPTWGWGPSWGMWNPWYSRPYYYVVGEGSGPNYGKRQTTGTSGATNYVTTRPSTRPTSPSVSTNPLGRERSAGSDDYYVRPSRRTYSNSNSSYGTSNTYNSSSRSYNSSGTTNSRSYNSNSSRSYSGGLNQSSGYSSPSRSYSGGGMSSPSRSSSGSSGSSGSRRGNN